MPAPCLSRPLPNPAQVDLVSAEDKADVIRKIKVRRSGSY